MNNYYILGARIPEDAKPGTLKTSLAATPGSFRAKNFIIFFFNLIFLQGVVNMTEQSQAHLQSEQAATAATENVDDSHRSSPQDQGYDETAATAAAAASDTSDGWIPTTDWVQAIK